MEILSIITLIVLGLLNLFRAFKINDGFSWFLSGSFLSIGLYKISELLLCH